jgi:hypothetical protein
MSIDFLNIPVPPRYAEEPFDSLVIKAHFNNFSRISSDDSVWRDIFDHDSASGDDRAVSDFDTAFNQAVISKPNIISNDDVPFYGEIKAVEDSFPPLLKDGKWIGADGVPGLCLRITKRLIISEVLPSFL